MSSVSSFCSTAGNMSGNRKIYCEAANDKVLSQKKGRRKSCAVLKVNWICIEKFSSYIQSMQYVLKKMKFKQNSKNAGVSCATTM